MLPTTQTKLLRTKELPSYQYLRVNDNLEEMVGKEVFARNETDWGDYTYWEKGTFCSMELLDNYAPKKSTKANWIVMINGRQRTFSWCAIQIPDESDGTKICPDAWPGSEPMKGSST